MAIDEGNYVETHFSYPDDVYTWYLEKAGASGDKAVRAVVAGDSDKVEAVNDAETSILSVRIYV